MQSCIYFPLSMGIFLCTNPPHLLNPYSTLFKPYLNPIKTLDLAQFALSADGCRLASASEKGMYYVRILYNRILYNRYINFITVLFKPLQRHAYPHLELPQRRAAQGAA
jgi:hypothetical protein